MKTDNPMEMLTQIEVDRILLSAEKELISEMSAQVGSITSLILAQVVNESNQVDLRENKNLHDFAIFSEFLRKSIPRTFKLDAVDLNGGTIEAKVLRDMMFGDFDVDGTLSKAVMALEFIFPKFIPNENTYVKELQGHFREHLTNVSIGLGLMWDKGRQEAIDDWTGSRELALTWIDHAEVNQEDIVEDGLKNSNQDLDDKFDQLRTTALLSIKNNAHSKSVHEFGEWLVFVKIIDNERERTTFTREFEDISIEESTNNIKEMITGMELTLDSKDTFLRLLDDSQRKWEDKKTSSMTIASMTP